MGINPFCSVMRGADPGGSRKGELKVRKEDGRGEAARKLPNPDPGNFTIERMEEIGDFLLARVCYPDCTNFGGVKILLYRDVSMGQLMSVKDLDPHFAGGKFSPVARFMPTVDGWILGEMFARMLLGKENQDCKEKIYSWKD